MDYSSLASSIMISSPPKSAAMVTAPLASSSPLPRPRQHQRARILRLDSTFDVDKSNNSLETIEEEGSPEAETHAAGDGFQRGDHHRGQNRANEPSFSRQLSFRSLEASQSESESILHGSILENSSRAREIEERALRIAEFKLRVIDALRRNLQRYERDHGAGSVSSNRSSRLRNNSASFTEEYTRKELSALVESVVTEIGGCYDSRQLTVAVDENMNLNLVPFAFHEDRQLDVHVRLQGDRNAAAGEGLRQHLTRWIERSVDRDDVIRKVGSASVVGSQVLAGNLAGWSTAYIIQSCGKVALTAVGGGLVLLKLASDRGYILVNWSNIYDQLEQVAVTGDKKEDGMLDDWLTRKVKSVKTFAQNNSYMVVGFMCGFFYRTLG